MRYYSIQGQEMPCCFIKDASKFVSTEHIASEHVESIGLVSVTSTGVRVSHSGESKSSSWYSN